MTAVLIVEDESLIRMAICDHLEDSGFTVYEARDADEAVTLLSARSDVNILFTDVDMPGSMDGVQLSRAVSSRWPSIRIFVTSGLWRLKNEDLPHEALFIPKPYNAEDLVHHFRSASRAVS